MVNEIVRKAFHLMGFLIIPAYMLFNRKEIVIILVVLIGIALILESIRFKTSLFRFIERPQERKRLAAHIYTLVGVLVLVLLFDKEVVIFSTVVALMGDASAGFGHRYGKRRIVRNGYKTWEGILSGLCGAYLASLFLLYAVVRLNPMVLVVPLLVALPDLVDCRVNDNLTLPLVMGFATYIITIL